MKRCAINPSLKEQNKSQKSLQWVPGVPLHPTPKSGQEQRGPGHRRDLTLTPRYCQAQLPVTIMATPAQRHLKGKVCGELAPAPPPSAHARPAPLTRSSAAATPVMGPAAPEPARQEMDPGFQREYSRSPE